MAIGFAVFAYPAHFVAGYFFGTATFAFSSALIIYGLLSGQLRGADEKKPERWYEYSEREFALYLYGSGIPRRIDLSSITKVAVIRDEDTVYSIELMRSFVTAALVKGCSNQKEFLEALEARVPKERIQTRRVFHL